MLCFFGQINPQNKFQINPQNKLKRKKKEKLKKKKWGSEGN